MAHRAGLSAAATLARAPGRCCRSPCRRRRPTTWIDVRGYPEGRSSRRVAVLSRLISRVVVLACQLRPHAWSPTVRAHWLWLTVTLSSADSGRTLSYYSSTNAGQNRLANVYGHTQCNIPYLVRTAQSGHCRPRQYYGGGAVGSLFLCVAGSGGPSVVGRSFGSAQAPICAL